MNLYIYIFIYLYILIHSTGSVSLENLTNTKIKQRPQNCEGKKYPAKMCFNFEGYRKIVSK